MTEYKSVQIKKIEKIDITYDSDFTLLGYRFLHLLKRV